MDGGLPLALDWAFGQKESAGKGKCERRWGRGNKECAELFLYIVIVYFKNRCQLEKWMSFFSNKKLLKVEIEEEDAGVLLLQTLDKSCVP